LYHSHHNQIVFPSWWINLSCAGFLPFCLHTLVQASSINPGFWPFGKIICIVLFWGRAAPNSFKSLFQLVGMDARSTIDIFIFARNPLYPCYSPAALSTCLRRGAECFLLTAGYPRTGDRKGRGHHGYAPGKYPLCISYRIYSSSFTHFRGNALSIYCSSASHLLYNGNIL